MPDFLADFFEGRAKASRLPLLRPRQSSCKPLFSKRDGLPTSGWGRPRPPEKGASCGVRGLRPEAGNSALASRGKRTDAPEKPPESRTLSAHARNFYRSELDAARSRFATVAVTGELVGRELDETLGDDRSQQGIVRVA